MEQELIKNLQAVFDVYQGASGLAASTIWARACGDARFMSRVLAGGSFTPRTYDSILRWFSDNWPQDAVWPEGVSRPQTEAA